MQHNKRNPRQSSAMDGFVRRNRGNTPRRASLENTRNSKIHRQVDGFVPRAASSQQPLHFTEPKSDWVDENTLTIDSSEATNRPLITTERLAGKEKQPHFWQFFKKRRMQRGKPEPSRRKKIVKRVLLVLLLLGILVGGFLGWKFLRATSKVFDGNVLGFLDNTKLRGEDEGRVNILLAGTSEDDAGHGGADLTDSIMIASIDTRNNTGFTVSVPRDLWVKYGERCSAGFEGKINVAYQCGNDVNFKEAGYFEGGMGLLQKVISTNFGIPIHYYGKINYTAFKDSVDAVGGIKINIKSDDPRGIMDRNFDWQCRYKCYKVRYPNGPAELNGEQALLLARARGANGNTYGTGGDFGRTERQRQMLVALKSKALSAGVITNPAKLGDLLDAAGDNVETNFKGGEVRRLYDLSKKISNDKIKSIDLADEKDPLVTTASLPGPISIVQPVAGLSNFSAIKSYFKKLTSNDPVVREGASVVVLNGSGVAGLAQTKADQIAVKGIDIAKIGNATTRDNTVIVDLTNGKKNGTKNLLEKQFKASATTNKANYPEATAYQADFVVIIGTKSTTTSGNN